MNQNVRNTANATIIIEKNNSIGDISENLFGSFLEHVGRAIYTGIYEPTHSSADTNGFRIDVIDLVRELNVPIVRYPGGNFVSGYRWQDGIGDKSLRPKKLELAWKTIETNQVGIDEFAKWSKLAGCEVMPTVNMGTGTPQDAADFVEYCNFSSGSYWSDMRIKNGSKNAYSFKHWCIGNEMDGEWQICKMTANEYGKKANETIKLMKMVDNDIKVTVAGSSSPILTTYPEWDRQVLENTYEMTDYISLHRYYGFNSNSDNDKDYLYSFIDFDNFINSIVATADYVKALKRNKKTMMLSLDEWNIWHQHKNIEKNDWISAAPILENQYNMMDALAFSGMMISLINHADRIRVGCMAQLVNVIAPIMTMPDGSVLKQTIFYPYKMGCNFAKGTAIKCIVDCEETETVYGTSQIIYTASAYDQINHDITLFLLNPSPKNIFTELNFNHFNKLSQTGRFVLHHNNLNAANTFSDPEKVIMVQTEGKRVICNSENIILEAYSFQVFRYKEEQQ